MKIAFITSGRGHRGGHVVLTEIIRALSHEGHDVTTAVVEIEPTLRKKW